MAVCNIDIESILLTYALFAGRWNPPGNSRAVHPAQDCILSANSLRASHIPNSESRFTIAKVKFRILNSSDEFHPESVAAIDLPKEFDLVENPLQAKCVTEITHKFSRSIINDRKALSSLIVYKLIICQ